MERILHDQHQQLDSVHWWFKARRDIVGSFLNKRSLDSSVRILDVGSCGGGMLDLLINYGHVDAVEKDATSAEALRAKYGDRIGVIHAECGPQSRFDSHEFISMFDVLEHIDDDVGTLKSLTESLPSGGWFVATVPAFQFLWSGHDVLNEHKRRYTAKELRTKIEGAGLTIKRLTYFNTFLFPMIWASRMISNATGRTDSDVTLPSAFVNRILYRIFSFEKRVLSSTDLPFGVSLIVIAQKP